MHCLKQYNNINVIFVLFLNLCNDSSRLSWDCVEFAYPCKLKETYFERHLVNLINSAPTQLQQSQ